MLISKRSPFAFLFAMGVTTGALLCAEVTGHLAHVVVCAIFSAWGTFLGYFVSDFVRERKVLLAWGLMLGLSFGKYETNRAFRKRCADMLRDPPRRGIDRHAN